MTSFARLLSEHARSYTGRNASVVRQAPAFYRLLVRIRDEKSLPPDLRPVVKSAIDYIEDICGIYGLSEDVFIGAFVANIVFHEDAESRELLQRYWDRKSPIAASIQMVLNLERELVGDKKEQILARSDSAPK